ncbi:EamA family transporter [Oryzibacter oryziterrae]|uniref:EamA family transporter n=1 Tax=Oryzibacter oryziterrae TaxID=2766474 RepID=UPI001F45E471|nr:EamA family transporter [Oryzibacter oryziterrae]
MSRNLDMLITALAPMIWGSTYIVTTELLPAGHPLTVALLRALPAGLLLLALTRTLPSGIWWLRVAVLGALNFSIFWYLLFVSAYRLPGGVAATVGAIQPLIVVVLQRFLLGGKLRPASVGIGVAGLAGVALLVIGPKAALDPVGIAAGLAGACSMAAGSVMTRKWRPPVSTLTFTAWQLTAGGLLLAPVALLSEPMLTTLSLANVVGFLWLSLIGAALTYILWFRGLSRLQPSTVAPLGFLSPLTAVVLGWSILGQSMTPLQILGAAIVLGSVWANQRLGS